MQLIYVRPRRGHADWDPARAAQLCFLLESAVQRRFPRGIKARRRRRSCLSLLFTHTLHSLLHSPRSINLQDHIPKPFPKTSLQTKPYFKHTGLQVHVHLDSERHAPLAGLTQAFADAGLYITRAKARARARAHSIFFRAAAAALRGCRARG